MQYLLTEEEYKKLTEIKTWRLKLDKKKLQELCTRIADTMPVNWGWGELPDPKPWGCMHTRDNWYCDVCPVTEICPSTSKAYSK